jgi:thiol:disulfide interchange protein
LVFHSPGSDEVKAKVAATGAVLLRAKAAADFSDENLRDVAIYRSLKKFKRAGFPTNVVYPADPKLRPILMPELLSQKMVLHALSLAAGEDQKLAAN